MTTKREEYIQRYKGLHTATDGFMDTKGNVQKSTKLFDGKNFEEKIWKHVKPYIADKKSFRFLDYGCGKARHIHDRLIEGKSLLEHFAGKCQSIYLYDPAYPPYSEHPGYETPFHIVSCSDVMEHVPEEAVWEVLEDIFSLTHDHDNAVFFSISGQKAYKSFADGENLHCTIKPIEWWVEQITDAGIQKFVLVYTDKVGEQTVKRGFDNAAV